MMFLALFFGILPFTEGTLTQEQKDGLLERHNFYRRKQANFNKGAGMKEMEWDSDLAQVAQDFADTGPFTGHNGNRKEAYAALGGSGYVGENWFSGAPLGGSSPMPEDAVHAWVDFAWPKEWTGAPADCSERDAFNDGQSGGCQGQTGHFTQVLWELSYKVGCGYTSAHGTTCNYSPAGNFNGNFPYQFGEPCSQCTNGDHTNCVNNLCSSSSNGGTTPTTAPPTPSPTPPTTAPPTSSICTSWDETSVYDALGCNQCPDGHLPDCNCLCIRPSSVVTTYVNNGGIMQFDWCDFNCPAYCCVNGHGNLVECAAKKSIGSFGDQEPMPIARTSQSPPMISEDSDNSAFNNHYHWSILSLSVSAIYMLL